MEEARTDVPPPPVERDAPSSFSQSVPELYKARSRSVRLIISIPVLALLIVLTSGIILFLYLSEVAESYWLFPQTRTTIERAALVVLWLSIGISLFSGGFGYFLARQIVRPIRELMETMEQIAEGDLETKVEPIPLGEFSQLGNTFNRMMVQLNRIFEERDRQLHESFSGAHLVVDGRGNILEADINISRFLGLGLAELSGINLFDTRRIEVLRNNPRFLEALEEVVAMTFQGRRVSRTVAVRPPGNQKQSRYMISSLKLEGHESSRIMIEIRDISGIATFYEQMQRADRLAAIGTLATGMAHEVRNPLASIRGMVQLLAESIPEDSDSATYYQRVLREVDRVENLIASIMDFAKSDDSPPAKVDVNDLLVEVIHCARHHVGEVGGRIKVTWELDDQLASPVLRADSLRQALLNIAINAFQHCAQNESGSIRVHTSLHGGSHPRPLFICIANPGEPFDEETRERIFEPFFTTKAEGTGLGLPIASQMIHQNAGALEVRCAKGEVQFWITLPMDAHSSSTSRMVRRLYFTGTTADDEEEE